MKRDVECLRREQEKATLKQETMLGEALQLLNTLVSVHSGKLCPVEAADKAMQTSPGQDKGVQTVQDTPDRQVSALDCGVRKRKKKPTSRCRWRPRRPLVRHRSQFTVVDENSQPDIDCSKRQNVSRPLGESPGLSEVSSRGSESSLQPNTKSRPTKTGGCFITPLSCWSHESSNPESPKNVNPVPEIVVLDSSPPDALWQLFEMD